MPNATFSHFLYMAKDSQGKELGLYETGEEARKHPGCVLIEQLKYFNPSRKVVWDINDEPTYCPNKLFKKMADADKRRLAVVEMRDVEGKSFVEIGTLMGISGNRVQQLYSTAKRLQKYREERRPWDIVPHKVVHVRVEPLSNDYEIEDQER